MNVVFLLVSVDTEIYHTSHCHPMQSYLSKLRTLKTEQGQVHETLEMEGNSCGVNGDIRICLTCLCSVVRVVTVIPTLSRASTHGTSVLLLDGLPSSSRFVKADLGRASCD